MNIANKQRKEIKSPNTIITVLSRKNLRESDNISLIVRCSRSRKICNVSDNRLVQVKRMIPKVDIPEISFIKKIMRKINEA